MESKFLVNFNCPVQLLAAFDEAIKGRYSGRTDALLDAMRDKIRELEEEKRVSKIDQEAEKEA